MFKMTPTPTFKAKVQGFVPGNAAAGMTVEFKHLNRPAARKFFDGIQGKTDAEALSEIVVGWDAETPLTAEALGQLLDDYPAASMAMFDTFRRELLEAKTKN